MSEQPILWWLAHNTLFAAALAVIVYFACRYLHLRPAVRHILWLLVLVKLATPPILTWPWSPDWPSRLAVSPDSRETVSNAIHENKSLPFSSGYKLQGENQSKL